ncbi:MAG: class II aldolase/adducin family protein, partial [Actinomycetota bacterium]|nr:class II aldolase/adducin family protein [Actinomycetota bacterium]
MRDEVLAVARDLHRLGLVHGTAGNVSARLSDRSVCVTPSSLSYGDMTVDDLVIVDLAEAVLDGRRPASSELALHLACYRAFS